MKNTTQEVLVYLAVVGALVAAGMAIWGSAGYSNQEKAQRLYESINSKFNLYQMVNKTPPPLIIRYKFDLYRTIEEETGYWSNYNASLTRQIQQKKFAALEKSLPENRINWTIEQKETYDYAVKSAAEFTNINMMPSKYMQTLKEDLNNFKVDINPPLNTKNTSAHLPEAVMSLQYNANARGRE